MIAALPRTRSSWLLPVCCQPPCAWLPRSLPHHQLLHVRPGAHELFLAESRTWLAQVARLHLRNATCFLGHSSGLVHYQVIRRALHSLVVDNPQLPKCHAARMMRAPRAGPHADMLCRHQGLCHHRELLRSQDRVPVGRLLLGAVEMSCFHHLSGVANA